MRNSAKEKYKVAVLGSGNWGSVAAKLIASNTLKDNDFHGNFYSSITFYCYCIIQFWYVLRKFSRIHFDFAWFLSFSPLLLYDVIQMKLECGCMMKHYQVGRNCLLSLIKPMWEFALDYIMYSWNYLFLWKLLFRLLGCVIRWMSSISLL